MPVPILAVQNLWKRYLVGRRTPRDGHYTYLDLREVVRRELRSIGRKAMDVVRGRQVVQGDEVEEFWALKDINFEVNEGEVLGIIGRNGAGKSTLLKVLSRITEPTSGRVALRGRVASLLEVGTGFHPELSGRENIYLNGAILGMSRAEIRNKFDEIVAFAEVEKFLDTPVKRYSSGMYVRLAFAVAAHLEPEILIVDEVLAVGDAEFQKKCLGKMDEVSRRQGRTVLLVSHNMGTIASLCSTVIWLEQGLIQECGSTRDIINRYLVRRSSRTEKTVELTEQTRDKRVMDDRLRLQALEWVSEFPLRHGEQAKARVHFKTRAPVPGLAVGIGFSTPEGTRLLTYNSDFQNGFRPDISAPGEYSVEVAIDSLPLAPGLYGLDVGCRSGISHALDYIPGCSQVEVTVGITTPDSIGRTTPGVYSCSNWAWEIADSEPRHLQLVI